jgi:hypothetical protein
LWLVVVWGGSRGYAAPPREPTIGNIPNPLGWPYVSPGWSGVQEGSFGRCEVVVILGR